MESIDIKSEILDSDSSPSRALTRNPPSSRCQPLHPKVPAELESIHAFCVMCIYEYTQRRNLSKMHSRAGQALVLAMDKSLHSQGDSEDDFAEAKRRAWWICVNINRLSKSFGNA